MSTAYTAADLIDAMYLAALGRHADDAGRENYLSMLEAQDGDVAAVAGNIHTSEERRRLSQSKVLVDHSQYGEYPKLLRRLVGRGARHGVIVDVGARGRERSNSYDLLSAFDWYGLLVEANPALHRAIEEEFAGTDFRLARCAVGPEEGTMPFYIGANDDVSSLRASHASGWGDLRGEVMVPVRRLSGLLTEHRVPHDFDILSLDIEGVDVEVLNDLVDNSDYRPRYVVIEASYSFATRTLRDVQCSPRVCYSYDIVDQTEANLILAYNG